MDTYLKCTLVRATTVEDRMEAKHMLRWTDELVTICLPGKIFDKTANFTPTHSTATQEIQAAVGKILEL